MMTSYEIAEEVIPLLEQFPWITIDGVVDYECRWEGDKQVPEDTHNNDCLWTLYHNSKL